MASPRNAAVADAIDELPEALRAGASRWFERMEAHAGGGAIVNTESLARVVAVSEFAANTAAKELRWLDEQKDFLQSAPDLEQLQAFASQIGNSDAPVEVVKQQLREYRHRYLLHVLWREIEGQATLDETLAALSELADRLLDAAAKHSARRMRGRFGVIRDDGGDAVSIVILGMGKLGGNELNFSSDIDVIFLHPGGNESDGARALSADEYFTRQSRLIVALLDEVTSDGFVFRIDTRLRPFGDSGPPVVSFAALESYLLQHGRDWERYAYVKARIVGPAPPTAVVDDLYGNMIVPFVYRRYLDFGVFESLRDMHARIAAEVRRRELADNIKLGPGGIREIEFIVQSLQLVRGGSRVSLQGQNLQTVLPKLVGHHGVAESDADELRDAYRFLRRLENFIQGMRDQQSHELPGDNVDRERLCVAMRYANWSELLRDLNAHRGNVTRQFEKIAFRQRVDSADDQLKERFEILWSNVAPTAEWSLALASENFQDADDLALTLTTFCNARATRRIDSISQQRLQRFVPNLLLLLLCSTKPVLVLQRVLAIVEQVLRRSAYLSLLNENELAMERFVQLCEQSAYIADQISRFPVLLDELLDPRIYTERITRRALANELRERLQAAGAVDSEAQMEVLGRFQRASQFRIAVADFNGSLPIMRVSDSLTDLGETVLDQALHIAWQDMAEVHGIPEYTVNGESRGAGFCIVAYGKFGGIELSYRSDLDLVFLHDSMGEEQMTNGDRPLDNSMFFTRLVKRLVHFLTTQTGSGILYQIDTRLRPDGQSGLLVTSVEAYEKYQEENAWTWEHQALLRARSVAGSKKIAGEFERIRADTLTKRVRLDTLGDDVLSMRRRMRDKLDKSESGRFDLKQGSGGIADIEFIVQYLVLANAAKHPPVIEFSDNIRQLETLAAAGCLPQADALRLQDTYRCYRLRLHHLALDDKATVVNSDEFEAERRFVNTQWRHYLGT